MISRTLPIILIIVAGGLYFTYISPTYTNKIIPLKAEIAQSNEALAAAEDFKQKEAQIATERAAIPQEGLTRLLAYLPDGVDNVQQVLDLNALATRSGISLSNFNIKDNSAANASQAAASGNGNQQIMTNSGKVTDSLDLSYTATGTYASLRTFLFGLEHSLRPLDITQINVTDSKTGVYTYDITLRIYWLH